MTTSSSDALVEALDPSTTAARLAQLAPTSVEVRVAIAGHPNAYESLLDWLVSSGEPSVIAAVARRAVSSGTIVTADATLPAVPADISPVAVSDPAPGALPQYAVTASTTAAAAVDPARRRRRLTALVGGGVAVALIVGAGAAFGVPLLLGGGSASATAAALPGGAMAWAEGAIDPSPQQKLEALAFFQKSTGLRDRLEGERGVRIDDDSDVRKAVWDTLDLGSQLGMDYDDDVAPWIGGRIGVAVYPAGEDDPSDTATTILAIETTDSSAAQKRIVDHLSARNSDAGATVRGDYVLVTKTSFDIDAAFAKGTLADDPLFSAAAPSFGARGLGAAWFAPARVLTWNADRERGSFEEAKATLEADYDRLRPEVAKTADRSADCASVDGYTDAYSAMLDNGFYGSRQAAVSSPRFAQYTQLIEDCAGSVPDYDWGTEFGYSYEEMSGSEDSLVMSRLGDQETILAGATALADRLDPVSYTATVRLADGALEATAQSVGGLLDEPLTVQADPDRLATLPGDAPAAVSLSDGADVVDLLGDDGSFLGALANQTPYSLNTSTWTEDGVIAWGDPRWTTLTGDTVRDQLGSFRDVGWDTLESMLGDEFTVTGPAECPYIDDCVEWVDGVYASGSDTRALESAFEEARIFDIEVDDDSGEVRGTPTNEGTPAGPADEDDALGSSTAFRRALPDLSGSFLAGYLSIPNMSRVLATYPGMDMSSIDAAEGIEGVGVTVSPSRDGRDLSVRLRLVASDD